MVLPTCSRSKDVIEPLPVPQWFCDCSVGGERKKEKKEEDEEIWVFVFICCLFCSVAFQFLHIIFSVALTKGMAAKAVKAVKEGSLRLIPDR